MILDIPALSYGHAFLVCLTLLQRTGGFYTFIHVYVAARYLLLGSETIPSGNYRMRTSSAMQWISLSV